MGFPNCAVDDKPASADRPRKQQQKHWNRYGQETARHRLFPVEAYP